MKVYAGGGAAWLICPRMLELDPRLASRPHVWPACRQGQLCLLEHEHETLPPDAEGHASAHFAWWPGSEHVDHHAAELRCQCGALLVHGDGADPWAAEWVEVAGAPHSQALEASNGA